MKSDAHEVAASILSACRSRGIEVSNLKLQKLLYYSEAWHLVLERSSLYEDRIEAWVHGPVVPSVFREYKSFNWSPITECRTTPSADPEVGAHLESVLESYGSLSATALERLSHSERPWIEARAGLASDEPSSAAISRDSMTKYFSSLLGQ